MRSIFIFLAILLFQPHVEAKEPDFELLSSKIYAQLSPQKQKEYVNEIRKAWLEFENTYPRETQKSVLLWQRLFLDVADAAETKICIIGGALRETVNAGNGRFVCPTKGLGCKDKYPDGFRCGPIFGEDNCVPRLPISDLSQRCYDNSASQKPLKPEDYERLINTTFGKDFELLCSEKTVTNKDGCRLLAQRINDLAETKKYRLVKNEALQEYNKHPFAPSTALVNIPGCSNGEEAGAVVPRFAISPQLPDNQICGFRNNKKLLEKLGQSDCKKVQLDNLFVTRFTTKDHSLLLNQTDVLDGVVEEVSVYEQKSQNNTVYTFQMLVPNILIDPPVMKRENVMIRQDGEKYFVINDRDHTSQEVEVMNVPRNRTLEADTRIRYAPTLKPFDSRTIFNKDCSLATQLKTDNLYPAGIPIVFPDAPNTAAGSK
jgi:hypothetical protein